MAERAAPDKGLVVAQALKGMRMVRPSRCYVYLAHLSLALAVTITLFLAAPMSARAHRDARAGGANIASIHMLGPRAGWAIESADPPYDDRWSLLTTTNSGRTWTTLRPYVAPPSPHRGVHLHVNAPFTRVSDLSFVDRLHGWALGTSCPGSDGTCALALRATADGGRTWHALPAPPASPAYVGGPNSLSQVAAIRFANALDGWAFGPGLYVTRDGGHTWSPDRRIGAVVALEPRGRNVWALSSTCPDDTAPPSARCRLTLFVSDDLGRTWRQGPAGTRLHDTLGQIVRTDAGDGWIRAWNGLVSQDTTLLATHDGGATWRTVADPCAGLGYHRYSRLAARGARELWALCGGQPGAGAEGKALYVSRDGGRYWRLVAATCGFGMRWSARLNTLPVSGYVGDLAVPSAGTAWIALHRGPLYVSRDGGHTWHPSPDVRRETTPGEDTGPIAFVDAAHGWLASVNKVVRTVDGGAHWTAATLL